MAAGETKTKGNLAIMKYNTRSVEYKRQIVEEALSDLSSRAAMCRKHNITTEQLRIWKKKYIAGLLNIAPVENDALKGRIKELEGAVGRLTMDNIFLKKALKHALSQQNQSEDSSEITSSISKAREEDVKC